jgi:predicted dienelactone hydrolase
MRTLEIIIPCTLLIYLLWPLITGQKRTRAANALPLFALLFTGLHLVFEKYRWQMIPIYALVVICSITGILGLVRPAEGKFKRLSWKNAGLVASLLVLIVATALPVLLPIPTVPNPSGPYKIGTTTMVLTDSSRHEIYSGNPDDLRRFMVQVWYPAVPTASSVRAPWMANADIVAPSLSDYLHLPHFFLDHLTLMKTNSYIDAPADISGAPYPVLLFSHGWSGFRAQNTDQVQELVSHGYVVIALEYTYADRVAVFPDGTVVPNDPAILPEGVPTAEYDASARKLLVQWTGDLAYTLDTFTALNANDPAGRFTGLLDLARVGAFGHSTGGGATIQFCASDPRCKAAFGMDAWMTPVSEQVLNTGSDRPMLFLFSVTFPTKKNWQLFDQLASHLTGPFTVATIQGTQHYDFTDLPLLTPLAHQIGLKGPLNGPRVVQIINDYSLAFFDQTLKGIPTTLLQGASPSYPELEFRPAP